MTRTDAGDYIPEVFERHDPPIGHPFLRTHPATGKPLRRAVLAEITADGTSPFDPTTGNGNDSSSNNGVVRVGDLIRSIFPVCWTG